MRSGRRPAGAPATSCPDCLSFGSSYGTQSYCRACYDFTRRYHPGECASCRQILAVKKGHCRLCWLQAGLIATGRRITPADLARAGRHQQLSFAGMSRLGHTGPRPPVPETERPRLPAPAAGTQLQLPVPGQSRHFDKAHWVASSINGPPCSRPGASPPNSPPPAAGTPGSSPRPAVPWLSSWPITSPGK